jgi:SAM-dependent methyltransferase
MKVRALIAPGSRVLDIGCNNGELFLQCESLIGEGVGIDPELKEPVSTAKYRLIKGMFPVDLGDTEPFDVITMLAVLEHIPRGQQRGLAESCSRLLKPRGLLAITVPSPLVDHILNVLRFLRLIDGMSLEQHYGYEPRETVSIFTVDGLVPQEIAKFQMGLNNLFVFVKT